MLSPARQKPNFRPRPGGGFNTGLGHFSEHLDEDAMQQSMQQKQLTQQAADPASAAAAAAAGQQAKARTQPRAGQARPGQPTQSHPGQPAQPPAQPREVGTLTDELVMRPAKDILGELKNFFSINVWLGIDPPNPDSPQDVARKKQVHSRYQKLTQEQQEVAKKRYQEEMERKKQEEEAKERRKQEIEQKKREQPIMPPSGPKKGPVGLMGNKKQKAAQKIQQDRQRLGGPASAN